MLANFSDAELVLAVAVLVAAVMLLPLGVATLYLRPAGGGAFSESFQGQFAARRPFLLSSREQELLRRLRVAFPHYNSLPHVDLQKVVSLLPSDISSQGASTLQTRIQGVQLGFLVCAPDMRPLLAIDFVEDDSVFERTTLADLGKRAALKSAGIPLVTVRASTMPTPAQLAIVLEDQPNNGNTL